MEFAYHKFCLGRPVKAPIPEKFDKTGQPICGQYVNGRLISLGHNWVTADLEFEDIFEVITVFGNAYSPALTSTHRINENFKSCGLALVDIDSGMRIEELETFDFYQKYGSGFYTTPSHSEEAHRFRILYRLETPITDAENMQVLYSALLAVHGHADISCKDAARLFFGTINAPRKEITKRVLTSTGVEFAINQLILKEPEILQSPQQPNIVYEQATEQEVIEILDEVHKHYSAFSYQQRMSVARAVESVLGSNRAIIEMRRRWPETPEHSTSYEFLLQKPRKSNSPTIGSLIYLIRKVDPDYRVGNKIKKSHRVIKNDLVL